MVRHFPPCNSNDRKPFSGTARANIPIAQTIARLYGMRSRADKSCPSRHQNALPFKVSHESLLFCLLQQMLSFKLSISSRARRIVPPRQGRYLQALVPPAQPAPAEARRKSAATRTDWPTSP